MTQIRETFLIDSNSLITPYRLYYPFDFASRFWNQLFEKIECKDVIILDLVRDELLKGEDDLSKWIAKIDNSLILDRREAAIVAKYREVLSHIQTSGLYQEKALTAWSQAHIADPWLIATACTYVHTITTAQRL